MSHNPIGRIDMIVTEPAGTVIWVSLPGFERDSAGVVRSLSARGLLLPRGPIETSFLTAWEQHGPGDYTIQFDQQWGCIGATPVARINP